MIDLVDDLALHDRFQLREVDDVAGPLVHRAGDKDVESIVMSVPVRVVALAEQRAILLLGERGIMHAMCRVELHAANDGDDGQGARE